MASTSGEQSVSSIAEARRWQRSGIPQLDRPPFIASSPPKETTIRRKTERFEDIYSQGDDHIVCVIEENHSQKIIATGSLFIVKKLFRNCRKEGHIGDILVYSSVRGEASGAEDHTVLI
ncbi:glucosamine 6-phosphate N-acetyltransferase-like [Aristolochia californica]|uniref:glucosamine 6-phosphate N-acetyltransferase-like n=1 Tax=Aristolochia californica TaxID=171875 RepID=UPI0035D6064F